MDKFRSQYFNLVKMWARMISALCSLFCVIIAVIALWQLLSEGSTDYPVSTFPWLVLFFIVSILIFRMTGKKQ